MNSKKTLIFKIYLPTTTKENQYDYLDFHNGLEKNWSMLNQFAYTLK